MWKNRCYTNDIPDESPKELGDKVPSYKKIAMAILKNDNQLTSLGFTPKESDYYGHYKRIELKQREEDNLNKPAKPKQEKLF